MSDTYVRIVHYTSHDSFWDHNAKKCCSKVKTVVINTSKMFQDRDERRTRKQSKSLCIHSYYIFFYTSSYKTRKKFEDKEGQGIFSSSSYQKNICLTVIL
jgi:hypothetical protein